MRINLNQVRAIGTFGLTQCAADAGRWPGRMIQRAKEERREHMEGCILCTNGPGTLRG